jgi:hypothetical protein
MRFETLCALGMAGAGAHLSGQEPPIHPLGPTLARSREVLTAPAVRQLSDGSVLINDVGDRRLLVFDSTLKNYRVIADSVGASGAVYTSRIGSLIRYTGDSSLFVDVSSLSMIVIDPTGAFGRVLAAPRPQDAMALANASFGTPDFDARGRLVYRGLPEIRLPTRLPDGKLSETDIADSAPILRADLRSRILDTLAFVRTPKSKMVVSRDSAGRIMLTSEVNPLPIVDEWAVTSDGAVAIIRGRDYHVDWIESNGSTKSSPTMPFPWRHLGDSEKVAFVDSVRAIRERNADPQTASTVSTGGHQTNSVRPSPSNPTSSFGPKIVVHFVDPSQLPDYEPPFFTGSTRADANGHVWIRTIQSTAIPGGSIYDVVNGNGLLVDRVLVPENRVVIGFGLGETVYLLARERNGNYLERVALH